MVRSLSLCVCVALLVVAARPGLGAPVPGKADAKAFYKSGTQHYNLAEFEAALSDFKEAYRLHSDPVFLFNIAQCHRRLGNSIDAVTFYRSYLRESPAAPNRAEVEKIVAELEAQNTAKQQEAERLKAQEAERAKAQEAAARPANGADVAVVVAAPPAKKPLVKKPWFWVAVVGGAAVVATAISVGVVFGTPPRGPQATDTVVVR